MLSVTKAFNAAWLKSSEVQPLSPAIATIAAAHPGGLRGPRWLLLSSLPYEANGHPEPTAVFPLAWCVLLRAKGNMHFLRRICLHCTRLCGLSEAICRFAAYQERRQSSEEKNYKAAAAWTTAFVYTTRGNTGDLVQRATGYWPCAKLKSLATLIGQVYYLRYIFWKTLHPGVAAGFVNSISFHTITTHPFARLYFCTSFCTVTHTSRRISCCLWPSCVFAFWSFCLA